MIRAIRALKKEPALYAVRRLRRRPPDAVLKTGLSPNIGATHLYVYYTAFTTTVVTAGGKRENARPYRYARRQEPKDVLRWYLATFRARDRRTDPDLRNKAEGLTT